MAQKSRAALIKDFKSIRTEAQKKLASVQAKQKENAKKLKEIQKVFDKENAENDKVHKKSFQAEQKLNSEIARLEEKIDFFHLVSNDIVLNVEGTKITGTVSPNSDQAKEVRLALRQLLAKQETLTKKALDSMDKCYNEFQKKSAPLDKQDKALEEQGNELADIISQCGVEIDNFIDDDKRETEEKTNKQKEDAKVLVTSEKLAKDLRKLL